MPVNIFLEDHCIKDKVLIQFASPMSDLTAANEIPFGPTRTLPDPAVCGAKPIGAISVFGHCMVDRPVECRYVLYFGEGNICRHPRWREFAAKHSPTDDSKAA
jgi:hypothetical protein